LDERAVGIFVGVREAGRIKIHSYDLATQTVYWVRLLGRTATLGCPVR
jgi:hypothetical protein